MHSVILNRSKEMGLMFLKNFKFLNAIILSLVAVSMISGCMLAKQKSNPGSFFPDPDGGDPNDSFKAPCSQGDGIPTEGVVNCSPPLMNSPDPRRAPADVEKNAELYGWDIWSNFNLYYFLRCPSGTCPGKLSPFSIYSGIEMAP